MQTNMNDLYGMADQNLNDAPQTDPTSEWFPVKLVNAYRHEEPVVVDVHPLHTVEAVVEAARIKLALGSLPISEMNMTCNGYTAKPSQTMKSLGLSKSMVVGDNYPELLVDPSGSNG